MADRSQRAAESAAPPEPDLAREVWLLMSDLVLDHERRRDVSQAVGLSFARTRAVRRVAEQPLTMGELAEMLGVDRPNLTGVVDDLERRGLVQRVAHPTDRRAKLVQATPDGQELARRADEILASPPPGLGKLAPRELAVLRDLLQQARTPRER